MLYKKRFKLKQYWKDLLKGIDDIKRENGQKPSWSPTRYYFWDKQNWTVGGHTIILRPKQVKLLIGEDLSQIYHRNNLTLKIFLQPNAEELDFGSYHWGSGNNLIVTSIIQNLFWFGGLAPRIYDLVGLEDDGLVRAAQVTEYIFSSDEDSRTDPYESELEDSFLQKAKDFAVHNRINLWDVDNRNFKNDKLVDFEGASFDNSRQNFKLEFDEKIKRGLAYAGDVGSNIPYQSVEVLEISGRRNNLLRNRFIKVDSKELPNNFTVLDIGCNGAFFLRRAAEAGATKAVGVDVPAVNEAAFWLNHYLGYFCMDFVEQIPDESFDLVFFLSAYEYFPDRESIYKKTKHVLWFEGHGGHPATDYLPELEKYFKKVEVIGTVVDIPETERVIIKCTK